MSDEFIFNQVSLSVLANAHGFKIHGDFVIKEPFTLAGLIAWDLEFVNVCKAVDFARAVMEHVVDINIRQGDCVRDLYSSVVLTLITPNTTPN